MAGERRERQHQEDHDWYEPAGWPVANLHRDGVTESDHVIVFHCHEDCEKNDEREQDPPF